MSQEAVIALFVLSVTLQTGALFPLLVHILRGLNAIENRLTHLEATEKNKCHP
jgi:hypothetical protein